MGKKAQRRREREFELLKKGPKIDWTDIVRIPHPHGRPHVWAQRLTPDGKDHYHTITKEFVVNHRPPEYMRQKIRRMLRTRETETPTGRVLW